MVHPHPQGSPLSLYKKGMRLVPILVLFGAFAALALAQCEHSNCHNGGACVVHENKAQCVCAPGWEGRFCTARECGANAQYVYEHDACECVYPFVGEQCDTCRAATPGTVWACVAENGSRFFPLEISTARIDTAVAGNFPNMTVFRVGDTHNDVHYDCACRPLSSEGAARSVLEIAHTSPMHVSRMLDMQGRAISLSDDRVNQGIVVALIIMSVLSFAGLTAIHLITTFLLSFKIRA